jgi:transcriptional regulator with XRE-family HTH domain
MDFRNYKALRKALRLSQLAIARGANIPLYRLQYLDQGLESEIKLSDAKKLRIFFKAEIDRRVDMFNKELQEIEN